MTFTFTRRTFLAGSAAAAAVASLPAIAVAQDAPGITFKVGSVVAEGQSFMLPIAVTVNVDTDLPADTELTIFARALDDSGLVTGPSSIAPRLSTIAPTDEGAGEYSFALPEDVPAHTPVTFELLWKTGLFNFSYLPRTQVLAVVVIPGETYREVQSEEFIYEGIPAAPISAESSSPLSS
ncbi:twin-arginine translocation signal domain-containing protein [Corynebacterium glucuronolyticum]|uniref:Twin-arginine translocation signal domain-containing protein n=2 Tax=Corynebacterium glucuronolyticum TaxID=39791 RepID=A0AAX1L9Z1_9CORY|nr:twin-arginine translocation signal domain-containing protein [Corynebacterium glucuronolyticum]EEI63476.1 Tat pathway signal sequence domain protein [Corynebacterium glucuronolyticum ATCC 51866]QRP71048.1 twin-arginine translocation signal domain-containing protein [Corynebacterium glucuronolyticum]